MGAIGVAKNSDDLRAACAIGSVPARAQWRAASYVRLSKEDGLSGESDSIASQRELIAGWAAAQPGVLMVAEYADDGFSGATFDRPGFLRMIDDARRGMFDTIVVKDLSRFGRSYLDCGNWIERELPRLGVRLYSICDDFDSMQRWDYDMALLLPMKNLMNEMQVITTSQKVRASLAAKRERGEFVGNFAPFGYVKDARNRHRLTVDPAAGAVVQRIFSLFATGESASSIARMLNAEGISSPAAHKRASGSAYRSGFCANILHKRGLGESSTEDAGVPLWHAKTVLRILRDEVYTGTLVQGKTRRPNWRMRLSLPVPAEERARTACAHEALVSREMFTQVSERLDRDAVGRDIDVSAVEEARRSLGGLRMACADCHAPMRRIISRSKGRSYVYWVCSAHRAKACRCSPHSIREENLLAQVARLRLDRASVASTILLVSEAGAVALG